MRFVSDFVVGDLLRWWPDGEITIGARRIDGTLMSHSPPCLRVTASHGFTRALHFGGFLMPQVGSIVDTSVSPGIVQRIQRRPNLREQDGALVLDTAHGPIKITADPTVPPGEVKFAQPGAGSADYSKVLDGASWSLKPPTKPAGYRIARVVTEPTRPEEPSGERCPHGHLVGYSEMPNCCKQPWPVKMSYESRPAVRLDGFDQRQVDQAKAVMLAPAPPRYPTKGRP